MCEYSQVCKLDVCCCSLLVHLDVCISLLVRFGAQISLLVWLRGWITGLGLLWLLG